MIDIIDAVIRESSTDQTINRVTIAEYNQIPNKTTEGKPITEIAAEPTTEFDIKKEFIPGQARLVLKKLSDLKLENLGEINAVLEAEVNALIKEDAVDLEQKLEVLIEKYFTKVVIEGMGGRVQKIEGKVKIQEGYEVFINSQYRNIIESLPDCVIKNNYKNEKIIINIIRAYNFNKLFTIEC